jgi:DNA replication protein DnaC
MNRKATTPSVDLDATRQRLERLALPHAAEQLEALISDAVKHNTAPHRLLDQLLEAELERREERRLQTSLRLSGLPTGRWQNPSGGRPGGQGHRARLRRGVLPA